MSKFNGIYSLDLFFTGNFGADLTEIHFIGLKGDFSDVSPGYAIVPAFFSVCARGAAGEAVLRWAPFACVLLWLRR